MGPTRANLFALIDEHSKRPSVRGGKPLSVTELAELAKLSRSTIYRYYPDVLDKLKETRAPCAQYRRDSTSLKLRLLRDRLAGQKQLSGALAKACVELLAELAELREDIREQVEAHRLRVASLERRLRSEARVSSISSRR